MAPQTVDCTVCGKKYPFGKLFTCNCGGLLSVNYDYETIRDSVTRGSFGKGEGLIKRYLPLLPLHDLPHMHSLGEGATPLRLCRRLGEVLGVPHLWLKDESRNPTLSFKDRAIAVGISLAASLGMSQFVTASTGNAAASLAAYSAKAGVECFVLLPSTAEISKLFQAISHGGKTISIDASIDKILTLVRQLHERLQWYPLPTVGPINPYQLEGNKTAAYEVCQEMQWTPPDWLIVPVGGGDNLYANWKGYSEMERLSFTQRVPRIVGVQAEGAAPVVKAFRKGSSRIEPVGNPQTIASGIRIGDPPTGLAALRSIRNSGGLAEAVSDSDILRAQRILATKEGVLAETSAATTVAALEKLRAQGTIDRSETVLCLITGSGVKEAASLTSHMKLPAPVPPSLEDVIRVAKQ